MALTDYFRRVSAAVRISPAGRRIGSFFQFIGANNAGVRVTHEVAFQVAAVWACIDAISSAMSSSDWNVLAGIRGESDKQALPQDGLQYVLNTRFNPLMTAQAGKRAMLIAAVGYGNGYAEIERDLANRIVALWPISPDRVEPLHDESGSFVYRVTQTTIGGTIDLDPAEIFHIRGSSLVGFVGDDTIARAIQSIAVSVALDRFGAAYFQNGAQLGGVLEYTGKLEDTAFDRLQKQFNSKHQGAGNAFKTAILEGGMKWTAVSSDAQKAQMIEAKYQQVEEICRWFRVPPHKIAHLLRATNNNIEHQGLEFTRDTCRPWIKEIEQEGDYKLIPIRGQKKFIEIDMDWAEQGDYGSRMTAYSTARGMGVFSVNDVLRKLGENTIGPVGDVRTMNGAAVRLEDVGKNMTPAPATAKEAANDEEAEDVARAWLTSVYARVQRRYQKRVEASGKAMALIDAMTYGTEQVGELSEHLGAQQHAAQLQLVAMLTQSLTPEAAATAVLNKETA